MLRLGFKPVTARWLVQTDPLSNGSCHKILRFQTFEHLEGP